MRRDDWKLQLRAELAAADRRAWKWGEHDCCAFAARVADRLRDGDIAPRLAIEYSDEEGAQAYIKSFGSLTAAVSSWAGEVAPLLHLRDGDVVLCSLTSGETLGVQAGTVVACAAARGLLYFPLSVRLTGWRID